MARTGDQRNADEIKSTGQRQYDAPLNTYPEPDRPAGKPELSGEENDADVGSDQAALKDVLDQFLRDMARLDRDALERIRQSGTDAESMAVGDSDAEGVSANSAIAGEKRLRLSSYAILSTPMKGGGYVLLSGLTGAMDAINDELHNLVREKTRNADTREIRFFENELEDKVRELWLERCHLTYLSHTEEKKRLEAAARALHYRQRLEPGFVIVPDAGCNYACTYCFERNLHTRLSSGEEAKSKMDGEEAARVFRAIDRIAVGVQAAKAIILYGGEPLRIENKGVVEQIVRMGAERGYTFSAVTNGHDLDVFIPLLGEGRISDIQVTLDGPPRIHDQRRLPRDGSPSYERVTANLRRALRETDARLHIRVNADEGNRDAICELLERFRDDGWLDNERIRIRIAEVFCGDRCGPLSPLKDAEALKDSLRNFMESYPRIAVGSLTSHAGRIIGALSADKPYPLRSAYCAAAAGQYIFLPGGKIYCCWESVGNARGEIGEYAEDGAALDPSRAPEWFGRNAALIPACSDCAYCLICAGGCPQHALDSSQSLYTPYCGDFPEAYPALLAEYADRYLSARGF
ncbi:MAG: SPASM domain-containing protein [Clostridiales bacterium]|nr:SPASM domain-containing protein [Clostridiales bacterium]